MPITVVRPPRRVDGGSPYVYEFAWRSPLFDGRFGAVHALEIGFVFDNLGRDGAMRFDRTGGTVVMDPAANERQLWDGIR